MLLPFEPPLQLLLLLLSMTSLYPPELILRYLLGFLCANIGQLTHGSHSILIEVDETWDKNCLSGGTGCEVINSDSE